MKKAVYLLVGCLAAVWGGLLRAEMPGMTKSSDRLFVANRDADYVSVIDMKTLKLMGKLTTDTWAGAHMIMAWSGKTGQKILVSLPMRNEVEIIDVETGKLEARVPLGRAPEHFAIEKNDLYPEYLAYIGNLEDGTVSVIDLGQNKEIKRIEGFHEPHGVTFTSDGTKAYIANLGAHRVDVVDARKHEVIKQLSIGDVYQVASKDPARYLSDIKGIVNATITPDQKYVYAADGDSNLVAVIYTKKDAIIKTIPVGENPWRAYASPDGKWMLVPNNGDDTVSVIDARKQRLKTTFPAGGTMTGVNFVNGGKKAYVIATTETEGLLYVYDLVSMKELGTIVLGKGLRLETGTTSPDGKKVFLACSTDNSIYMIDGATDKVTRIPDVGVTPWGTASEGDMAFYCH